MRYESEKIKEIIENTWSMQKMKKEFCLGKQVAVTLNKAEGKRLIKCEDILKKDTIFYKEFYIAAQRQRKPERSEGTKQVQLPNL